MKKGILLAAFVLFASAQAQVKDFYVQAMPVKLTFQGKPTPAQRVEMCMSFITNGLTKAGAKILGKAVSNEDKMGAMGLINAAYGNKYMITVTCHQDSPVVIVNVINPNKAEAPKDFPAKLLKAINQ